MGIRADSNCQPAAQEDAFAMTFWRKRFAMRVFYSSDDATASILSAALTVILDKKKKIRKQVSSDYADIHLSIR
jgi:hypothetical protein